MLMFYGYFSDTFCFFVSGFPSLLHRLLLARSSLWEDALRPGSAVCSLHNSFPGVCDCLCDCLCLCVCVSQCNYPWSFPLVCIIYMTQTKVFSIRDHKHLFSFRVNSDSQRWLKCCFWEARYWSSRIICWHWPITPYALISNLLV